MRLTAIVPGGRPDEEAIDAYVARARVLQDSALEKWRFANEQAQTWKKWGFANKQAQTADSEEHE